MLYAVGIILIAANVFLRIFISKIDKEQEEDYQCRTCIYNTVVSNQYPTICDECKHGDKYYNWLEGGRK